MRHKTYHYSCEKSFGYRHIQDYSVVQEVNGSLEMAASFKEIFDRKSYKSNISLPCNCGGWLEGVGYLATGNTLTNGYTPKPNELLKIVFIQCGLCGAIET